MCDRRWWGKTANTAAIGISIPLAVFNRNQGEIARARVAR